MQAELVSFGIDLFDREDEAPGAAKGFSSEVDGLAYGGGTFWLTTFYLDIGPLGIAFPLYEVPPDHLDRRRDDRGGTDCQAHRRFLLSRSGWVVLWQDCQRPAHAINGLVGNVGDGLA